MRDSREKEFEIRAYGRTELAQMYFPNLSADSAWAKLKRWIDGDAALSASLNATGYISQRTFTPRQVKIIIEYLDKPF